MPAIFYLCLGSLLGILFLQVLFPCRQNKIQKDFAAGLFSHPRFYIPAGVITGITILTFLNYFLILFITFLVPFDISAILPANIISCSLSLIVCIILLRKSRPFKNSISSNIDIKSTVFYSFCVIFFFIVAIYLFYSSFYRKDHTIYSGISVFSDFAPHTALTSSFAKGGNYPTEYPHFPGDQISYHFFFYFLCGNLHALGFSIEHAINIPSILAAVSSFMLLGSFAVELSKKKSSFFLAPILLLFRQSFAFISLYKNLKQESSHFGDILKAMFSQTEWIGDTPYDNWGLWSINVYANQRHFLWGVSLLLIVLPFYLPYTQQMISKLKFKKPLASMLKACFFSREAWVFSDIKTADNTIHPLRMSSRIKCFFSIFWSIRPTSVFPLLIIAIMPYFHGSALISLLLILLCLSIFSANKIFFLISAIVAVGSSLIQTRFFSGGAENIAQFQLVPGFVIPQHLGSSMDYLLTCFGLVVPLAILLLFFLKGFFLKLFLVACFFPFIFAFLFQITIDMTANHKFIQITLILFCIFKAFFLQRLFAAYSRKKELKNSHYDPEKNPDHIWLTPPILRLLSIICKVLTIFLLFISIITGIVEWSIYKNINQQTITMNLDSKLTQWIEENTPEKSIFLTAPYSMNPFFLSGRFAYYGHPYYAWSAGHDTDQRLETYKDLLLGCNNRFEEFLAICRRENIQYVLIDDTFRTQEFPADELFFQRELNVAAIFEEENNSIIYRIPV